MKPARLLAAHILGLAVALNTSAWAADRESKYRNVTDASVDYQMSARTLAYGTRCARAKSWQEYDIEKLRAEYREARDYLEARSPEWRIMADFEVTRFLQAMHEVGINGGDEAYLRTCESLGDVMLKKYRTQPSP